MKDNDQITLCIPLGYTYLTKPSDELEPDSNHLIIYETQSTGTLWRTVDTRETTGQFAKSLSKSSSSGLLIDCLPPLRNVVDNINQRYTDLIAELNEDKILDNNMITITLKGPLQQVNKERSHIYRNYFQVERWHVGIPKTILYPLELNENNSININRHLCLYLEEIAEYCGVSILITNFLDKIPYVSTPADDFLSADSDLDIEKYPYHILIYGDQDASRFAHFRVRVILERLGMGNSHGDIGSIIVDAIPMDLSRQSLIAGPSGGNLIQIQQQTGVKIFTMDLLPEILSGFNSNNRNSDYDNTDGDHDGDGNGNDPSDNDEETIPEQAVLKDLNQIYLVGQELNVTLAKALIREVSERTELVVKDCVMAFVKLDLLVTRYRPKVREIMNRLGTFIQLPYFGSNRSLVRVMGTTASSVEMTISELMRLATDFYEAYYSIHTGKSDEDGILVRPQSQKNINVSDRDFLPKIVASTGCLISSQENSLFEIVGSGQEVKRTISMLTRLVEIDGITLHHQVSFRLEVALDLKSFVAGKKYGKMLRIMSNGNVWIQFVPFNEYNFFVNLLADEYTAAVTGIQLFEDELPSEISFYIPQTYHKQVIGQGGSNIQSTMKKHNVFIKFGNSLEEYPNAISIHKLNNVVIRCPSKNSKGMTLAKQELLDSVASRHHENSNTFIKLSRSHRRIILAEKCHLVKEIESKTNAIIQLSDVESDSGELVEISGLGSSSEVASRMIKAILPDDYEFKIAYSSKFANIVDEKSGDFYRNIVIPFRIALHIETQVFTRSKSTTREDDKDNTPPYHRIVLSFSQENVVGLDDAIQDLTSFLRERELDIIDRGEVHEDPIVPGTVSITGGHKRPIPSISGPAIPPTMQRQALAHHQYGNIPPPVAPAFGDDVATVYRYEENDPYFEQLSRPGSSSYGPASVAVNPYDRLGGQSSRSPPLSGYSGYDIRGPLPPSNYGNERWQDDDLYEPRRRERSPPPAKYPPDSGVRRRDYGHHY